ncbi:hypothetical protein I603_0280 [Erythrobacter dokdonensis DSW-74]|uniref:DUF2946 domain-containing protein n=1 Tax=Erythrobacter dokdonensis DSW-74 TaxID=1300349 RepID=A0A1A7BI40_9SPHN|nr:hypothetical protein I603_0280 [Erythrobacter dokdonensis DSW-74]
MARFALLLAAFAAVAQWAVPHGWMIGNARDGEALLVPCPGVSPALAALGRPAAPAPAPIPMAMAMAMMQGGEHAAHHAHHAMAGADAPAAAGDHSGHDGHASLASALCDFAALGAPVLPPEPIELDLLAPVAIVPPPLSRLALVPGRGLAAPPPPATGPPALSA